jgi:hypothetical protein
MGHNVPTYEYKNNPHYIEFTKQKEELKKKYPPQIFERPFTGGKSVKGIEQVKQDYIKNEQSIYRQYLKEVADLLFQPNGSFQELTWDIMAEVDKLEMERKASGRRNGGAHSEYLSW